MDIRKVKKLIELLEESGIAEIEISEGEESVRISRYPQGGGGTCPGHPGGNKNDVWHSADGVAWQALPGQPAGGLFES